MCDRILVIDNGIRTYESDVNYLKKMVKACEENRSKGYPCELLVEEMMKKENNIKLLRELREKDVVLCNMYKELDTIMKQCKK